MNAPADQRIAYLVVGIDTTTKPPTCTSAGIYGEGAMSLTGVIGHDRFAFDLMKATDPEFEGACRKIGRYLKTRPWCAAYEWVIPLLDERSKAYFDEATDDTGSDEGNQEE